MMLAFNKSLLPVHALLLLVWKSSEAFDLPRCNHISIQRRTRASAPLVTVAPFETFSTKSHEDRQHITSLSSTFPTSSAKAIPSPVPCLQSLVQGATSAAAAARTTTLAIPKSILGSIAVAIPSNGISSKLKRKRRLFNQLLQSTFLTYIPKRYTIYVLQCENSKFYIGCTTNLSRRLRQHKSSRGGSSWTRIHRPVKLIKSYKRIPQKYYLGLEAQITAEMMLAHGINNVRGAMFSETREYELKDLKALKGFLGHYNEISYKQLGYRLKNQLEDEKGTGGNTHARTMGNQVSVEGRKVFSRRKDKCFRCENMGHWANECPEAWSGLSRAGNRCARCGQKGHIAKDCNNSDI